ncbi:stage II sporulation protein P [Metabacillus halosaccharovorans]|uniref:stage II sporulation protein P n=1 Tax=Metabacillus halosaccharovorans TaxID=930124 RepID=UPI001C200541|nr:stage II sporulation protein P [Metabacillus halosaccharovorans]
MKSTIQFFFKLIYVPILVLVFIFCLIGIIITMQVTIDSYSIQRTIGSMNTEQLFAQFLQSENHYFYQEYDNQFMDASNISTLAIQLATSIKPTDARTFLGNELPGMRLYDTEIAVAGEGTDLTNIPFESPPPTEVLLKERKVAEEKLAGRELEQEEPVTNPENKTVFIYQSHSWESFLPLLKGATQPNDAISSDERANVIGLGSRLAQNLMKEGIGVEHDKTNMTQELHSKGWSSTQAYTLSGDIVDEAASTQENDFLYYLDLHRDSARKEITTKTINGESYARLYFVVGKENKDYQENLEFAKEIHHKLEEEFPGISRGVFLKTKSEGNGVYNQDVSNKALLVEIGGVDNHLDELERTIDAFAEVYAEFIRKEQKAKEVNTQ